MGPSPGLRKLAGPRGRRPAPPLTEESLHDPERVAEPILPTGHLAEGPGPARPGVPRRGSSSRARPLLAGSALPRRVILGRGPPGLPRAGNGGCSGGRQGTAGDWRAARAGPQPLLRTMAGNRRRRPRCLRPGWSSRGEGRRERAARPRGAGGGAGRIAGAGVTAWVGRGRDAAAGRPPSWRRAKRTARPASAMLTRGGPPLRARAAWCHLAPRVSVKGQTPEVGFIDYPLRGLAYVRVRSSLKAQAQRNHSVISGQN